VINTVENISTYKKTDILTIKENKRNAKIF